MRIKLLKPLYTVDGVRHEANEIVDVDTFHGSQLLAQGIGERHTEKKTDTSDKKE